jgi:uncharacterized membrane protein YeaQ/YmgE (transglycosylase-associated protein family)
LTTRRPANRRGKSAPARRSDGIEPARRGAEETRDGLRAYRCGNGSEGRTLGIIWSIIIGFLAGLVAKFLMPGRDPGGFIITTILGIIGAVVASYLGQAVGWYRPGEGAGFIGAVVGAVIVLAIYRMVVSRRTV